MKISYRLRLLCLFLTALLLAGCTPQYEVPEGDPVRLEIKQTAPVYTDAFLEDTTPRAVSLLSQLSRRTGGPLPSEAEKQKLSAFWVEEILPRAQTALIYENEWSALLAKCEATMATFEDKILEAGPCFTLLSRLYGDAVAVLGSRKAGTLAYECMQLYLMDRIAVCEERYEKYGYDWYLTDAQHYRRLHGDLTTRLNEALFGEAMAVLYCFTPLIPTASADTAPAPTAFPLYDAELLLFLQRQAKRSRELALGAEEWALLAELLTVCLPNGNGSTLSQKEYTVLKDLGYPQQAAHAMPAFLALIEATTAALDEEGLARLLDATDTTAKKEVLCAALADSETAFFAFADALTQYAQTAAEAERSMLDKAGRGADCETFLASTPAASANEVFAAISACADGMTPAEEQALDASMLGYSRGLAPYLTYIVKAG
ncbi:MAG: hypothetical protein IJW51_01440 [Clostridia bacterium]|nr:hypothetical protein [Clostridia bacterium]